MFLNIFNLKPKIISINENPQSDIKYQCYSSHFPNGFLHYTYTNVFFLGFTAEIFRDFLHNKFPEYSIFNSKACPGHTFRIHIIIYYQLSTLYLIFSITVSLLKLENWFIIQLSLALNMTISGH